MKKHTLASLMLVGFLAFIGTTATPAVAQVTTGKLTGVVTDAQTGEALAGAQVYLEGTGRGALTAENGRYFVVNVRPTTYTVVAELIGYQTFRVENVVIAIDETHVTNFQLTPQAIAVEEIRVEAERTPLIRVDATGTLSTRTGEELAELPVSSIEEALTLQQGFLAVPANTNIMSFQDTRRAVTGVRIRGGRSAETVTLIDGIPINNFVFGGPAFSLSLMAIDQIDFIRGGIEPQYGNALSGVINISTREGGSELEGEFEYLTSELAGALGSDPDDLENFDFFQGYVSGSVPGTEFGMESPRLRFMVAGRQETAADRVLEFDDEIFDFENRDRPDLNRLQPAEWDVIPGWRAMGYDETRDVMGKLTVFFTPTSKLDVTLIDAERQQLPFDFDFLRFNTDPFDGPLVDSQVDSLLILERTSSSEVEVLNFSSVQTSAKNNRTLLVGSYSQTLSRTAFSLKGGIFWQDRVSCNFNFGLCQETAFDDPNFDTDRFIRGGVTNFSPAYSTDEFGFGGEDLRTYVGRFDLQSQVSDHHNVQGGVYYEKHDLDFVQTSDLGVNGVIAVDQNYFAEPFNAALYLQDKIEYDFLTINLGFRIDWGKAGGLFFVDPLDPTNGTTAIDVCTNPGAFGSAPNPLTGEVITPNSAWTLETCGGATRDSAAIVAFADDLEESKTRTQFSPRIGVSFPVTASTSLFFNFSRVSQNPLYNNIYQNTSIGTEGEAIPCGFAPSLAERTNGCGPIVASSGYTPPFLGNPNLLIEETTTYEIGYLAELFDNYGLKLILFNKDQFGLTGLREALGISDPGSTYGTSTPNYRVLVNQDFQTVRGFEILLRRRLSDFWGFDLNYSWSQARTNASPPEREFQNQELVSLPVVNQEIVSDVDQPHRFNGIFRFRAGAEPPEIRIGDTNLGEALKYSKLLVTVQAASGFPYTPVRGFTEGANFSSRSLRNTGRGPGTWAVNLRAEKNIRIGNLLYGAVVRIENLFDTMNCVQPFETTGRCDAGTFDQTRSLQGNAVNQEQISSTFFDRPHQFDRRRRIALGLRVAF